MVWNHATNPWNSSLPGMTRAMFKLSANAGVSLLTGSHHARADRPPVRPSARAGPAPTHGNAIWAHRSGYSAARFRCPARGLTKQLEILALKRMVQTGLIAGNARRDFAGPPPTRLLPRNRDRPERAAPVTPCRRHRLPPPPPPPPQPSNSSASSGVLIRFEVMTGIPTCPISLRVTQAQPPRGTEVAMVGTRASCQPMPVLRMLAPAASIALASCTTSSKPPLPARHKINQRDAVDHDKIGANGGAHAAHHLDRQPASGFHRHPPSGSVRWLVAAHRNWFRK